jgi:Uncharacterized alpha/beta hydrolase domain (DUF2235)
VGKRIILLSDGTGNSASKVWRSNVWRVFESLDLTGKKQVAFYDDGVGTSSFKPLAILGGVFGYGLKRNVLDIYKFLCANYESADDEIYGFGFSRGAFTIRVVIGLVLDQGLVRGNTDAELFENAKLAYRAYRANLFHTVFRLEAPFRWIRDAVLRLFGVRYDQTRNRTVEKIKFLGLWDTVAAYGLPIDEMARGVSKWLFPLELPDRNFNHGIEQACHALSLDDERTTFHPVLWSEKGVPSGQLHQVWFAGVHSNVGGGYPDDSLAHIPLYWIMKSAEATGLKFKTASSTDPEQRADPDMVVVQKWLRDKDGRLYDSRNGFGGYYRYGPRRIDDLNHMKLSRRSGDEVSIEKAKIHETAINRAKAGAHRYAPIGVPRTYDLLTDNGLTDQSTVESADAATARCAKQEDIWNVVWRRRVIYFATVFASFYLALYPFFRLAPAEDEFTTPLSFISHAIRLLGQVLPGFFSSWIDAYARAPGQFLFVGGLAAGLILAGSMLGRVIESRMELVWRPTATATPSSTPASVWVRRIAALVGLYLLFYSVLPHVLHLPRPVHGWIIHYVTLSIRATLVLILLSMLPPAAVLHLRTAPPYRSFIRNMKLKWLPAFFAMSFVGIGALFGSHILFDLEDTAGYVCHADPKIAADRRATSDYGISRCLGPQVATCSSGGAVSCGSGAPVFCGEGTTPSCEFAPKEICDKDKNSGKCFANAVCRTAQASIAGPATCAAKCEVEPQKVQYKTLDVSKICNSTHIVVEQGQRYIIKITPNDTWTSAGLPVSARGVHRGELSSRWDKIVSALSWPLTRNLMQPRFVVFARIGDTGNDEYLLEPDSYKKDPVIEVPIVPRRSGELFLYVNEGVLPWPLPRDFFYRDNKGTATVEVRNVK